MADDESGTDADLSDDPTLRAIQLEKAAADKDTATANARKAAADADKAELDVRSAAQAAKYPAATTKPPEGKVEVGEKVGLVADLLAHSLLDDAADKIAAELEAPLTADSRVLLVDSRDLIASDWPYKAIREQLEYEASELAALKEKLARVPKKEPRKKEPTRPSLVPTPFLAATSAVGGVADLVSMFRSDYAISSREVAIGSPPLIAALAKRLIPKTAEVNLDKFVLLEGSELFEKFNTAAATRLEVERLARELKEQIVVPADRKLARAKDAETAYLGALGAKEAPSNAQLDKLRKLMGEAGKETHDDDGSIARARASVALAEAALQRFDTFATAVTKASDSGYPPLVAAAIRERLHPNGSGSAEGTRDQKVGPSSTATTLPGTTLPGAGYTHVLYATLESSGGETITRRTIFKSSVRFMGGAEVSYLLWSVAEQRLVAANSAPVLGEVGMNLAYGITDRIQPVDLTVSHEGGEREVPLRSLMRFLLPARN